MNWNYIGIDEDPPGGRLLILTRDGDIIHGKRYDPHIIAWQYPPKRNQFKETLAEILGGLPELRMAADLMKNESLFMELSVALHSYEGHPQLNEFVDLVRKLHAQYLKGQK
jgi:hypothetical protein